MKQPVLRMGSSDSSVVAAAAVRKVKETLAAHGYWTGSTETTSFGRQLHDAVVYWQQTHLGPGGKSLGSDGVVGKNTWWSLSHPTGKAQRSFLIPSVPSGLSAERALLLNTALGQHGAKERPGGSNRGPKVDQYLPSWCKKEGEKGPPWCCFFVSWVCKQALGNYPLGGRIGSCMKAYLAAEERGMWESADEGWAPTPGDAFVMLYRDEDGNYTGKGHIGLVLRVSKNGKTIQTIEGNCGNRVKAGERALDNPDIAGYIKLVADCSGFERGLSGKLQDVSSAGTR